MQTIYATNDLHITDVIGLANDYPAAFQAVGLELEIIDLTEAFKLSGAVEVFEDEEGIYIKVDGDSHRMYEA